MHRNILSGLMQVSPKFTDLFAFGGPAPENINGRLAMLGFVSAVGVELASGKDLFSQLGSGGVHILPRKTKISISFMPKSP
jgi:hypothetical protein